MSVNAASTTLDPRGASRAIAFAIRGLERRYEATASNLSNLETAGHKRLVTRSPTYSADPFATEVERARKGAPSVARDFRQGDLIQNGDRSDLALQGDGFFAVEQNGELRYARSARVHLDPDGTLIDAQGARLLGES